MTAVEWRPWLLDPRFTVGSDGTILGIWGRPLNHTVNKWGYAIIVVNLAGGRRLCTSRHRMVCETFHGPCPDGMEAAHRNGVHLDCRARNLEWKTKAANSHDRIGHGTNGVKLTTEQVQEIRLARGVTEKGPLAERYGVSPLTIKHIWTGHTWKQLAWPERSVSA